MTTCSYRHWFSTDPVGVYSYCDLVDGHGGDGIHIDSYGRWWKVSTVKEMSVDEQNQAKRKYANRRAP